MLFQVTMTPTEDNCPGYQRERMPEVRVDPVEKIEDTVAMAKALMEEAEKNQ